MVKTCKQCGIPREHRKRSDTGKLASRCNECLAAYSRRWRRENWRREKARNVWKGMIARCHDETTVRWYPGTGVPSYRDYGALGIRVCKRWRGSGGFEAFVKDMGLPSEKGATLDRRRPHRGYCPSNCRWVDKATQDQNRKNTVWVTAREPSTSKAVTLCLSEWGRRTGVDRRVIAGRLKRGWHPDRAVAEPTPSMLQLQGCPF